MNPGQPIPFPKPITEAYRQSGALEIACPHCGAEVGVHCTRDDGRVRRAPCVARCRVSRPVPGSSVPEPDSRPAERVSAPVDLDQPAWVDPSEPRWPKGDG